MNDVGSGVIGFFTHPAFILTASLFAFLVLAWLALPFSIYGTRGRLDRVIEALERIQRLLERAPPPPPPPSPSAVEESLAAQRRGPAQALFVNFRKEMLQLDPLLREREYDPSNVVVLYRDGDHIEVPIIYLTLTEERVEVSFPLQLLRQAFPTFSADRFQSYATSFLSEKYGYFTSPSPDGSKLQVRVEPRETNQLELFFGIVREELIDAIAGTKEEGA